jgi:hypothetical protein
LPLTFELLTTSPGNSLNTNGQDQLGNTIFYQQIFLTKRLGKWRKRVDKIIGISSEQMRAVDISLDRLEWTIYAMNLFVGLALEQVQLFSRPSRAKPVGYTGSGTTCEEHGDWTPYPVPHTPIAFHHDCHYLAYISLADVVADDEALYNAKRRSDTHSMARKFEELYTRLQEWPKTIKSCMTIHEHAIPHVIALQ